MNFKKVSTFVRITEDPIPEMINKSFINKVIIMNFNSLISEPFICHFNFFFLCDTRYSMCNSLVNSTEFDDLCSLGLGHAGAFRSLLSGGKFFCKT